MMKGGAAPRHPAKPHGKRQPQPQQQQHRTRNGKTATTPGQQKRLRDGRRWRYVDFDHTTSPTNNTEEGSWPHYAPPCAMWNSFLRQTDARRKKMAVEELVYAMLHESPRASPIPQSSSRDVTWLESDGTTAEERLGSLRRWIIAQLQPLLRTTSAHSPSSTSSAKDSRSVNRSEDGDECTTSEETDEEEADETKEEIDKAKEAENDEEDEEKEEVARKTDEVDHKQEHDTQTESDSDEGGATKSNKWRNELRQHEWHTQVLALRLAAALVVLCEAEHTHLFLNDFHESATRANKKDDKWMMLRTLHELALPTESQLCNSMSLSERAAGSEQRSKVRQEAMSTLAVVGLVLEDSAFIVETCEFLEQHYLKPRPEESIDEQRYKRLWYDEEAEGSTDESETSEGEEEEEEDESDEQPLSDDSPCESQEDEKNARQKGSYNRTDGDGDTATALEVIIFLLALLDDDKDDSWIRAFIGRSRNALMSMIFAKEGHNIAGTSKLRMHAAKLLSILFRLSPSTIDSDEGTESDSDDNASIEPQEEEEKDQMTGEGKRRFLTLLKAYSCSEGKRTRGHLRRRWERKQSTFFRKLRSELMAHESQRHGLEKKAGRHGGSGIDDEVEAGRIGRKEYHVGRFTGDWYVPRHAIPDYFKLEGWKWMARRDFLHKYFVEHFDGLMLHRIQFRSATKLLPVPSEYSSHVRYFDIQVFKVDKSKFEGKKTQTKRYRRTAGTNPVVDDSYSGSKRYIYDPAQAIARKGRNVEKEWRNAEKIGQW